MSDEKQETRADIIAEMRRGLDKSWHEIDREWLHDIPDRLEAAWKREREPKPLTIAEWIDKTETVADIAAVLRRYVLPSLAERLEAAWKREKAEVEADALNVGAVVATTEKSSAVGNAAAMREALANIAEYAKSALCHTEDSHVLGYLAQIENHANAALSAPARNCDLYATATEALKAQDVAFNEDNFKNGECRLGCPGCDDGLIDCKILWLFAPAAERKGDGDGR